MLFVVRLSNNLGRASDRLVPIAADNESAAILRVRRITPSPRCLSVESVTRIDGVEWYEYDDMIEGVEQWWGDYCDHAAGNEYVSEMDFDRAVDLMHESFDAVYDIMPE